MDLDYNEAQNLTLSAIAPLISRYRRLPDPAQPVYCTYGEALDKELEQGGYYGNADGLALQPSEAVLILEQVAQCPYAVPAMASLIVAPAIGQTGLPRPLALVPSLDPVPVRFLKHAKTALIDAGDKVLLLDLRGIDIKPVDNIFAYPYARFTDFDLSGAKLLEGVSPQSFRDSWRLGLTYEILGAMRAALDLTIDYTGQRKQFNRTIASFQAVQHRLAECATCVEATKYLAARSAASGNTAEIALATAYAQQHCWQIIYDCHQFHGAMGLTLEYPLHHWTYRLKVLAGELGGSSANGRIAAQALWG